MPIDLVYLDLGGTAVELISYEGDSVDPAPEKEHLGYRMIALEVDDMQKAIDDLKSKGVDVDPVTGFYAKSQHLRVELHGSVELAGDDLDVVYSFEPWCLGPVEVRCPMLLSSLRVCNARRTAR